MAHPSMTGFGSAQIDCPSGRLGLEIRSVNSRFFEFHPRLQEEFRWAEAMLRDRLQAKINRGKVECRLNISRSDTSLTATRINPAGLASALRLAHEIRTDHPEIAPFSVNDLLKLPGVVIESQLTSEQWTALIDQLIEDALAQFIRNRLAEGEKLIRTIEDRLVLLAQLCEKAHGLVPQAVVAQQHRLTEKLREALGAATGGLALEKDRLTALEERVRQEAAMFGLRLDIAEELDRLRAHIAAAREACMPTTGSSPRGIGKRLDFLTQEMNREANTLGSKSASIELSNISIEMKLLIEQIREQVQNLE